MMKEFEVSLKKISKKLYEKYPPNLGNRDIETVLRLAKLIEEVGELTEAVLDSIGQERKKNKEISLEDEIADVLITTLLLSEWLGINPWSKVKEKLKKVEMRLSD